MKDTDNTKSQVVVGEDGRFKFRPPKIFHRRSLIFLGLFGILVGSVFAGNYLFQKQKAEKLSKNIICSDQVIKESLPYLKSGAKNLEKLKPIVEKIKALNNFENDPNCMFIVLNYSINSGNSINSRAELSKLENNKTDFITAFGPSAKNIDQLRTEVEFTEKLNDEINKNSKSLNGF